MSTLLEPHTQHTSIAIVCVLKRLSVMKVRQTYRKKDWQVYRQTGIEAERQADGQTDRHRRRKTGRQTDSQAGRHRGRKTGRRTDRQSGMEEERQARIENKLFSEN